ncbi:MAG: hypothetical protein ACI8YX_001298, partial [Porticoccaceae bacterium]
SFAGDAGYIQLCLRDFRLTSIYLNSSEP